MATIIFYLVLPKKWFSKMGQTYIRLGGPESGPQRKTRKLVFNNGANLKKDLEDQSLDPKEKQENWF